MNSVYQINQGVGRPLVFRGLTAQYIWWLGGGILFCLLLFALLYLLGVTMSVCILLVFALAGAWIWKVYSLSQRNGEHGMMKKMASSAIPKWVKA
jgi:membrane protein implicated in regulation of membrane protease activity